MDEQFYQAMRKAAEAISNDPHLAALRRQAEEMEAAGLSTDGPTPPPCDPDIFKNGIQVFVTDTIGPNAIEGWVRRIAARSEQAVDWHWIGGQAVVLALGDIERVQATIAALLPEHDRPYHEAMRKMGL